MLRVCTDNPLVIAFNKALITHRDDIAKLWDNAELQDAVLALRKKEFSALCVRVLKRASVHFFEIFTKFLKNNNKLFVDVAILIEDDPKLPEKIRSFAKKMELLSSVRQSIIVRIKREAETELFNEKNKKPRLTDEPSKSTVSDSPSSALLASPVLESPSLPLQIFPLCSSFLLFGKGNEISTELVMRDEDWELAEQIPVVEAEAMQDESVKMVEELNTAWMGFFSCNDSLDDQQFLGEDFVPLTPGSDF